MTARTSIQIVPVAKLHAVQGDALTIRYQGESVTLHPRMSWLEFHDNQARIVAMLGEVTRAKLAYETSKNLNINADAIDDASQVYGDRDPNTLPFDPDLICDHDPVCDDRWIVSCRKCKEIL